MELRGSDFDRIRREHLRGVEVTDFAWVWLAAERRADALKIDGREDGYLAGVQWTCRWIANGEFRYEAPVDGRRGELARSPISRKSEFAIEELIEAETQAVERLIGRWEWPGRPGYVEGVFATLAWVWRRSGVPPIEVEQAHAS
ncbi:hypothetical protein E0H73_43135 [Kribbella pittospori]|uniref:Uncharacterized protein n=1 Tax=Kribbella pittospori TaxID=722689 RepID=A0A4R0K020_9ACTN|nr:hypothetical protein [Kribbella pittospori]TCC48075.1 hypothetical protein E0H73_43135 [Kribbella pittospori]